MKPENKTQGESEIFRVVAILKSRDEIPVLLEETFYSYAEATTFTGIEMMQMEAENVKEFIVVKEVKEC